MQGYEAHGHPGPMTESVCALLGQMFLEPYMFQRCSDQSRHPGCPHTGDTRGRGRGRDSVPCQAALRKRTHGHTMDQGLSLEQAHWQPLPCVQTSSAWSAR